MEIAITWSMIKYKTERKLELLLVQKWKKCICNDFLLTKLFELNHFGQTYKQVSIGEAKMLDL